jgi:hypothetical protein
MPRGGSQSDKRVTVSQFAFAICGKKSPLKCFSWHIERPQTEREDSLIGIQMLRAVKIGRVLTQLGQDRS